VEKKFLWGDRSLLAGVLLCVLGVAAVAAGLLPAFARWPMPMWSWGCILVATTISALRPSWGLYLVFLILPFFGNRPGGRYMELINVLVGSNIIGLTIHSLRHRIPFPRHPILLVGWACVISACVALLPVLPQVMTHWRQANSLHLVLIESFTSRETDVLYSIHSLGVLVFAVGWATALVWARIDRYVTNAFRATGIALLLTMTLGILDFHQIIDLDAQYLSVLDPRALDDPPFQSVYSIFWNPGWFAWYFSMAFGVSLGMSLLSPLRRRQVLLVFLAAAYAYFLTNRQRGGFVAVHVVLLIVGGYWLYHAGGIRRTVLFNKGALLTVAIAVVAAVALFATSSSQSQTGLERLLENPGDPVRTNLAITAFEMWQQAPLFGIGEGAFAWRYPEFVPLDSTRAVATYGDAHNTWLQILATRGGIGFLAYLGIWLILFRLIIRELRHPGSRAIPGVAALGAFFVYSFVQGMFYLQAIQIFFWGVIAMMVSMAPEPGARAMRRGSLVPVLAVICMAIVAVWIYWEPTVQSWEKGQVQPAGFYAVERLEDGRVGRWSSRTGTLCLYPTEDVTVVELQSNHPDIAKQPVVVTLRDASQVLGRVLLRSHDRVQRQINLPLARVSDRERPPGFGECVEDASRLTVSVDRVWSPLSVDLLPDPRHLGVFVSTEPVSVTQ
tara:strand:+ start:15886 stop:17895 length:2010 start_codon:yes stop_codon:yes gene_type:complete